MVISSWDREGDYRGLIMDIGKLSKVEVGKVWKNEAQDGVLGNI